MSTRTKEGLGIYQLLLPSSIISFTISLFFTIGMRIYLLERWSDNSFLISGTLESFIYYLCIIVTVSFLWVAVVCLRKLKKEASAS